MSIQILINKFSRSNHPVEAPQEDPGSENVPAQEKLVLVSDQAVDEVHHGSANGQVHGLAG